MEQWNKTIVKTEELQDTEVKTGYHRLRGGISPVWGFTVPRGPCGAGRGVEGSEHPDGTAGQAAGIRGAEVVAAAALVTLVRAGGRWRH